MGDRGRHIDDQTRAEIRLGLLEKSTTATKLAKRLGVNPDTVYLERDKLIAAGFESLASKSAPAETDDPHDARFWKGRAQQADRRAEELASVVRRLGTLDGLRVRVPPWHGLDETPRGSAVLIAHNSDWHLGERIDPDEINGWNKFDVAICQARVMRFIEAACELGRRWLGTTKCDGVLYTLGGDLTSGDIHDELSRTNELETLPSVRLAAGLAVACIKRLADEFGKVHVVAVPGNHGRTTKKPTAKRIGALSYDIMVAHLAAQALEGDTRISWQIASGADASVVLYRRLIVCTHGDRIGTGGGMGFAGPVLPIIRGGHKLTSQYASMDVAPDLILMGHYHTSAQPPRILANGSIPGVSEYGFAGRFGVDVPRQWAALFHSRWGLTSRCDVQLEAGPERPKPRVRATA